MTTEDFKVSLLLNYIIQKIPIHERPVKLLFYMKLTESLKTDICTI